VRLLTGRSSEARAEVEAAWESRLDAAPCVIGRILWFQTLFALENGSDVQALPGRLKTVLTQDAGIEEWRMSPVLGYLATRLPAHAHAFLCALAGALGDSAKIPALDRFEAWRTATPLSID
jgi:hypothetical protein